MEYFIDKMASAKNNSNCIGAVMFSVFACSVVDLGSSLDLDYIKGYKIGICYFPANYAH